MHVPHEFVDAGTEAAQRAAAEPIFEGAEATFGEVQRVAIRGALEAVLPMVRERLESELLLNRETMTSLARVDIEAALDTAFPEENS